MTNILKIHQLYTAVNGQESKVLCMLILCPAIGFVEILLKASHEGFIIWRIDEFRCLRQAIYEVLQTGRKRKQIK